MKQRKYKILVGDFETTVYEGQEHTEVWASGLVELGTENTVILHSIEDTLQYLVDLDENCIVYYHNLKFDGNFWLAYFLLKCRFRQAIEQDHNERNELTYKWLAEKDMPCWSFKYSISDRGQWYSITLKTNRHIIEFRDSYKLLPFSLKKIGESFGTKHKKLDMEYTGFRYAGCPITPKEESYLKNDLLVIKEALEITFSEGHTKLTIGSCCLDEFKRLYDIEDYEHVFPDLYHTQLSPEYKQPNVETYGDYVRRSYRGGWCYVNGCEEQMINHIGLTLDVNSLYPSMMHSCSGNYYPIGQPTFWSGNAIPISALKNNRYYFVTFRTRFYLKPGKLPFIQIKDNFLYRGNECLKTSDIRNIKDGKYYRYYTDSTGRKIDSSVVLTMAMTDYILFREHYDVEDFEILHGCWFETEIGLFDNYIDKYKEIKANSKGAKRELAKLFLNNLYGKFAASTDSSFKLAFLKEDETIGFVPVARHDKKPGYIPIGSAITSYARNFTIRAAQANYKYFLYADTDSLHMKCDISQVTGVKIHPTDFCCWKHETVWDEAIFTRQKTYIEHVIKDGDEEIEPYYNIKCAGMSEKSKDLFIKSVSGFISNSPVEIMEKWKEGATDDEIQFVSQKRILTDFAIGLVVPGKLMPKRYKGGVVLIETNYEMR